MRRKIEAKGATVSVAKVKPGKRGPKPQYQLTAAQIDKYRSDFESNVTRQAVCDKIYRDTSEQGNPIKLSVGQLNRIFKT